MRKLYRVQKTIQFKSDDRVLFDGFGFLDLLVNDGADIYLILRVRCSIWQNDLALLPTGTAHLQILQTADTNPPLETLHTLQYVQAASPGNPTSEPPYPTIRYNAPLGLGLGLAPSERLSLLFANANASTRVQYIVEWCHA